MEKTTFPKGFIFGTATSAYQVEGAYNEDGKGESIWDKFTHTPNKIFQNQTGDIACDYYHRYEEDLKLLKSLGVDSYRFSLCWPRIFPEGHGSVNQKGLDFYKKIIQRLNEYEIKPAITLYHWDLPQKLQDIGGWANADTIKYYEEYVSKAFKEFGKDVPIWITHNEPWVVTFCGNYFGNHAPGLKDAKTALTVAHNVLLSHGKAVQAYRSMNLDGKIGITLNLTSSHPASQKTEDIKAANNFEGYFNRWFLDPVLKGKYPEDIKKLYEEEKVMPIYREEDMKIISEPIDFLGVNYYSRNVVKFNENVPLINAECIDGPGMKTEMNWEVYPKGIYELLTKLNKDYHGIKIMITENGAAFNDGIEDDLRLDYIKNHLIEVKNAIDDGVNLEGYYLWSFMDNFEWAEGYEKRFGITYVDYETQKRTLKKSGEWYKQFIKDNH